MKTSETGVSRREFLRITGAFGFGLGLEIGRSVAEAAAPDKAVLGHFNPFLCEQNIDGIVGVRVIPSVGEIADFNSDDKFLSKTWVDEGEESYVVLGETHLPTLGWRKVYMISRWSPGNMHDGKGPARRRSKSSRHSLKTAKAASPLRHDAADLVIEIDISTTSYMLLVDREIKSWGVCPEDADHINCDLSRVSRRLLSSEDKVRRSKEDIDSERRRGMPEGEMEMIGAMVDGKQSEIFDQMKSQLEARGVLLELRSPAASSFSMPNLWLRRYSGIQHP